MKKFVDIILIIIVLGSILGRWQSAEAGPSAVYLVNEGLTQIDPALQDSLDSLQPGELLTVILTLRQQADLSRVQGVDQAARLHGVIQALQATARATQGSLNSLLRMRQSQGQVQSFTSLWIFNSFSVTATGEVINELAQHPDVLSIAPDAIQVVPAALGPAEANIALVNAPALWDLGYTGQGVVVANLDSGVNASHPDLASRYRGGSNSWYDPYGQHSNPFDPSGHGTATMGVMLGGDAGGTTVGMAPGARWIAVKIFNDQGGSTATAIHLGYQWLLDPDHDPATADAPQVVNNSWSFATPGCNLDFEPDLQALRAAGIMPVFAAGNYGPYSSSSASPANNPSAFAVGAVDNNNQIYAYSSRGPTTCGSSTGPFPELVAPGVNIYSTSLFDTYTSDSGTSLAAPHVAGGLALLISAFPSLSLGDQQSALVNSAVDLGSSGPDDAYGYGRLDVLAAYSWLAAGNHATPTPTSLPTATPSPTATSTPTNTPSAPVNLALNRLVIVSSFQDGSSTGAMAVDGNLSTLWKTVRYTGRNKPASEWITVDLGSSQSFSQVVLEWDAYYATSYTIDISSNNSSWTTVFSTSSGNGGNDTLSFSQVSARYVRLMTTGWSNSSLRNWLGELQVFAGSSAPAPTPTATPSPSPTPQPGGSGSAHIGDLEGASRSVNRKNWAATVTILVHDSAEAPLAGVTVSGAWSNGASGTCLSDGSGICQISSGNINTSTTIVTFSVTDASSSYTYDDSLNHDLNSNSDGTSILVNQ